MPSLVILLDSSKDNCRIRYQKDIGETKTGTKCCLCNFALFGTIALLFFVDFGIII